MSNGDCRMSNEKQEGRRRISNAELRPSATLCAALRAGIANGDVRVYNSVETVESPALWERACSTARQGSMAHLTRWGNLRTPAKSWRSPRLGEEEGCSTASPVTKSLKGRPTA